MSDSSHYRVTILDADDSPPAELQAAQARFCAALDLAIGDPALVLPVYRAWQRIAAVHGDQPDLAALTEAEAQIASMWMRAQTAAVAQAFGTHRYMGDAMFELDDPVS